MKPAAARQKILSRRAIGELGALEASVQELAGQRSQALRVFIASRNATTVAAQHEFWLEFSWTDQEYRAAVRRLAQFCLDHREGSRHGGRTDLAPSV